MKYRHGVRGGRVGLRLTELLEQIADEHGCQIVAKEVLPDHWHSLLWVSADDVSTSVVRALKGRGARVLRQEFPHLRNHAKVLWSPSYFVASVGYFSKSAARLYIHRRWDAVAAS
jgi:putative transposase